MPGERAYGGIRFCVPRAIADRRFKMTCMKERLMNRVRYTLVLAASAGLAPAAVGQMSFVQLFPCVGTTDARTEVRNLNADGSRVVGACLSFDFNVHNAVMWNAATGEIVHAVPVSPISNTTGEALDASGSVILGNEELSVGPTVIFRPFRHVVATGVSTEFPAGFANASAPVTLYDADAQGDLAVLQKFDFSTGVSSAYRYRISTNALELIGADREPQAIADTGAVVGISRFVPSQNWRWNGAGTEQTLCAYTDDALCQTVPGPPLPRFGVPRGISSDGATIVGYADVGGGYGGGTAIPFRYSDEDGLTLLTSLADCGAGYGGGEALDASVSSLPGGASVVGWFDCGGSRRAFLWRPGTGVGTGFMDVQNLLELSGINMGGWTLTDAVAISDDGTVIAGNGNYDSVQRAWVARIPLIIGPFCDSIDFNADDLFPDTGDIDDFLSVFSGGPCSNDPNCGDIDFNNDGLFPDTSDIDALLSVFSGGPCI
jgi:uncharacterized membrane protein